MRAPAALMRFLAALALASLALFAAAQPSLNLAASGTGQLSGRFSPASVGATLGIYARDTGGMWWGPKPDASPMRVAADGSFTVDAWSSAPGDAIAPVAVFTLPWPAAMPSLLGVPIPPALLASSDWIAKDRSGAVLGSSAAGPGSVNAGAVAGGGGAPPAAPVPPPSNVRSLTITSTGAVGTVDPIMGRVNNAPPGTVVTLYVADADGAWWGSKPQPGSVFPLASDGSFVIANWASAASDTAVTLMQVYAIPATATPPTVLGGQLPATMALAAVASQQITRSGGGGGGGSGTGSGGGTAPAPVPPAPVPPPQVPTTTGELPWPPAGAPVPGPKVNNGRALSFSGMDCIIKDTGGGVWGPGPNVFVGNQDFIWTDAWGLHLNVKPRGGCQAWASSECFFSRPLGYGTYILRAVGPMETQDPEVVYGLFTWDDNCPGDCWYREIDFEISRWGNAGDVNSEQYVVQPWTRPGNLRRVPLRQARTYGGELGATGGGACDSTGADNFNGALTNRITMVMQWHPREIRWFTFDGLWTLDGLRSGRAPLLSSLQYVYPESVFTPGDERIHLNLWQANTGAPAWGRRTHQIVAGFEFAPPYVDLPALGYPLNRMLLSTGRLLATQAVEALDPALIETLGLTRQEESVLLGIIHRQVVAAAESGAVDPDAVPKAWNDTAFVDWVEAFPLLDGAKHKGLLSGVGSAAKQAGRRLLATAANKLLPHHAPLSLTSPHVGRRALAAPPAVVGPGASYSCGDPRGMNDPARWATSGSDRGLVAPQPSLEDVYGTTYVQGQGRDRPFAPVQKAAAVSGEELAVGGAPAPTSGGGTSKATLIGASVGGALTAMTVLAAVGMLLGRKGRLGRMLPAASELVEGGGRSGGTSSRVAANGGEASEQAGSAAGLSSASSSGSGGGGRRSSRPAPRVEGSEERPSEEEDRPKRKPGAVQPT